MAPPLDRKDLYWRSRQNTYIRLPRRTRRATILCFALVIAAFYFLIDTATQWSIPKGIDIFHIPEQTIPIRFPALYPTLSRVIGSGGARKWNRNVIFVAGNLTAASRLAGVACDMAEYRRSHVHLALMGFDTMDVEEFRKINGLTDNKESEGCKVLLHDARPASAEQLPPERKKVALRSAFRHINEFMHPQAVFVDTMNEAEWFLEIAKEKTGQMETALIELDKNGVDDLRWINRLDSGALHAWHTPSFEVIIHADTHTGNLERLLKSLENAYYPSTTHRPTSITIVLDPFEPLHPFTKEYLRGYKFPAKSRVTIKRPLLPKNDPQAAARNFLESFYTLSDDHGVLFLDPNTELSKWYYHYLHYATLEYRYSSYRSMGSGTVYGISLEFPPSDIFGKPPFPLTDFHGSPFLYPAPNSRAALFFSQYWSELHSYVSHQLSPALNPGSRNASNTAPELVLSEELKTSWKAPLIELARARGYSMLYPSFKETLALVHNEIPSQRTSRERRGSEKRLVEKGFLELLPDSDLPSWGKLPQRDLWGETIDSTAAEKAALEYKLSITTCPADTKVVEFQVGDLFCDAEGNSL